MPLSGLFLKYRWIQRANPHLNSRQNDWAEGKYSNKTRTKQVPSLPLSELKQVFWVLRTEACKEENILYKFPLKQGKYYLLQCYLCSSSNPDGIIFWPVLLEAGLRNKFSQYLPTSATEVKSVPQSFRSFLWYKHLSTDPTNTSEEDISLFCISESSQNFSHIHIGKIHLSSFLSHMKFYVLHHWTYSCLNNSNH